MDVELPEPNYFTRRSMIPCRYETLTDAPDGAFTSDEVAAILKATEWALAHHRGLHWVIPAMLWKHDSLAGLPVERTNFPGRLDLIGRRSVFGEPCVLCTLHRTPDGPRVEGIPDTVVPEIVHPSRTPLGVDWGRLVVPAMRVPIAAGLALIVSAPAVAASVAGGASVVEPAAMPGPQPDPPPGVGDDGVPWSEDTGGPYNAVFNPPAAQGGGTDGLDAAGKPLDPTLPDLGSTGAEPGSDNFQRAVEAGERVRAEQDAAAALDAPEPAPEPVAVTPEPVVVDDGPEPEVIDITPSDAFPSDPDSEPMPLPELVEPPVTEAPPPAPAAPVPVPVEAPEVAPVESEATPEHPAGVLDSAAMRKAAGHFSAASDLLKQAADEVDAGNAALAGGSDPEVAGGQGGGVDTDTIEDGPTDMANADSAEGNDVDLDGVRVTVDISDLKVTVDGEPVDVELDGAIAVDTAGDDAPEVTTAA